jgi:hypothetical protein
MTIRRNAFKRNCTDTKMERVQIKNGFRRVLTAFRSYMGCVVILNFFFIFICMIYFDSTETESLLFALSIQYHVKRKSLCCVDSFVSLQSMFSNYLYIFILFGCFSLTFLFLSVLFLILMLSNSAIFQHPHLFQKMFFFLSTIK